MKQNRNKKIIFFFSVLFVFLFSKVHSQQPRLIQYTPENGLPSYVIYSIFQDSKGYIWFGTDAGVSRFDGKNFINFSTMNGLPDNSVLCFHEDYAGRIWFGSFSGKLSFFENNKIFPFKFNNIIVKYIDNKVISTLFVDKQNTVFINFKHSPPIKIEKTGQLSTFLSCQQGKILYLNNLNDSTIWVGVLKESQLKNWTLNLYYKNCLKNTIALGKQDILHFFSKVIRLPGKNILLSLSKKIFLIQNESLIYSDSTTFMNNFIYSLCNDNSGKIWLATEKGVYYFLNAAVQNHKLIKFSDIPANNVLIDREGNIWFTTLNNGVFFCNSSGYKTFFSRVGSNNNYIIDMVKSSDSNITLFSKNGNIFELENDFIKQVKLRFEKPIVEPYKIFVNSDQSIWITALTNKGPFLQIFQHGQIIKSTAIKGMVKSIIRKNNDSLILFATQRGIELFKNNQVIKTIPDNIDFRTTSIFADSKNSIWIGSLSGLYNLKGTEIIPYKSLKNNFQYSIADISEYKNKICLATNGHGLLIFDDDTLIELTDENGLSSNNCTSIFTDNKNIWVGTTNGLNKIFFDSITKGFIIEKYYMQDGLASSQIIKILGVGKKLFVLTPKGLTTVDFKLLKPPLVKPLLFFSSVNVNQKNLPLSPIYNLKYNENFIQIEVVSVWFKDLGADIFRYKIKDTDKWIYTSNNKIVLNSLEPGTYKFIIESINNNNGKVSASASIYFYIDKPFYEKWWFRLGLFFILASVACCLLYYYIKQTKKRAFEKSKLIDAEIKALRARINPHFLFNALSSIQKYILYKDSEKVDYYFSKFSALLRMMLTHSEKGTIDLNSEIEILKNYIELEQLRLDNKFSYTISTDKDIKLSNIFIPSMIIQPFVENAIWHGISDKESGGKIVICFELKNDNLCISIEDNGLGRSYAKQKAEKNNLKQSMSTNLLKNRLKLLNDYTCFKNSLIYEDIKNEQNQGAGTRALILIKFETKS